jgi:uncharacterized protein YecE (DUF72 family)
MHLCRTNVKNHREQNSGGCVYVGSSGWAYASWKPDFYPAGVSSKKLLEYYATQLNSVEVNYTFRTLPARANVDAWLAQTGPEFRFSFKAPQRITHFQRLQNSAATLDAFAAAIRPVADAGRLGLVLLQLPPNLKFDEKRLAAFLTEAQTPGLRMAFEFRHESWFVAATWRVLEQHGAALCVAESDDLETPDVATAPFSCYRLRKTDYAQAELAAIGRRLEKRARQGDVFAYFRHEDEPTGALRAVALLASLRKRTP